MEVPLKTLGVWVTIISLVHCQINSLPQAGQSQFFLDRHSDCDGKPREIYRSTVSIFGTSAEQQGQPLTSCTITLSTESGREPYRFKLQILEVSIKKAGVYFYIYDGEYNGKLLFAFSNTNQKPSNLDFIFTTGQLVTFRMTKNDTQMQTYTDIRVIATPVPSEIVDCNYGSEHMCNDEMAISILRNGTNDGVPNGECQILFFSIIIFCNLVWLGNFY